MFRLSEQSLLSMGPESGSYLLIRPRVLEMLGADTTFQPLQTLPSAGASALGTGAGLKSPCFPSHESPP